MRGLLRLQFWTVFLVWVSWNGVALAVPGPDTVVVVSQAENEGSAALAQAYADARAVPAGQVCAVDWGEGPDITLAQFQSGRAELLACLSASDALSRIEAVLLVRGVPLRVRIPVGASNQLVSFAAALSLHESTRDGTPLLGQAPGNASMCSGGPCTRAAHLNPFSMGIFEPGFERDLAGTTYRPWLVTMLHGRNDEEARSLLDSAVTAERDGPSGEFVFMNGADGARSALDREYDGVLAELSDRGIAARRVPFDADLTGLTLGAFVTGTAGIGDAIEGNTFTPGSLVDNLTSFGARPENFDAVAEEVQVSIARWVARGVSGVHGTTAEPLADAFPSRSFLIAYVDGGTLAEAYHRAIPYAYWQNLVLGDPMLAPYAVRPVVEVEGLGAAVPEGRELVARATDKEGLGVDSITVYWNGTFVAEAGADEIRFQLPGASGDMGTLLVVAQKRDDGSDRGLHRAKGWLSRGVQVGNPVDVGLDAGMDAGTGMQDAASPDSAALDAGAGSTDDGGCAVSDPEGATWWWLSSLALLALRLRR